jgi:hypothetical protein
VPGCIQNKNLQGKKNFKKMKWKKLSPNSGSYLEFSQYPLLYSVYILECNYSRSWTYEHDGVHFACILLDGGIRSRFRSKIALWWRRVKTFLFLASARQCSHRIQISFHFGRVSLVTGAGFTCFLWHTFFLWICSHYVDISFRWYLAVHIWYFGRIQTTNEAWPRSPCSRQRVLFGKAILLCALSFIEQDQRITLLHILRLISSVHCSF